MVEVAITQVDPKMEGYKYARSNDHPNGPPKKVWSNDGLKDPQYDKISGFPTPGLQTIFQT